MRVSHAGHSDDRTPQIHGGQTHPPYSGRNRQDPRAKFSQRLKRPAQQKRVIMNAIGSRSPKIEWQPAVHAAPPGPIPHRSRPNRVSANSVGGLSSSRNGGVLPIPPAGERQQFHVVRQIQELTELVLPIESNRLSGQPVATAAVAALSGRRTGKCPAPRPVRSPLGPPANSVRIGRTTSAALEIGCCGG
jgi:hypothetical protein